MHGCVRVRVRARVRLRVRVRVCVCVWLYSTIAGRMDEILIRLVLLCEIATWYGRTKKNRRRRRIFLFDPKQNYTNTGHHGTP